MLTHFTARQVKLAAPIGGDATRSFEQSFASLSYSYLQEKAPALLDYLIGFQLVDRNPDETRAAGVFGFNANGKIIYVPMFFLNKDLKGHEMMYLKDQDIFVPLKENWVNFVLSNSELDLGESEQMSLDELKPDNPDLRALSRVPTLGKMGSASPRLNPALSDWVKPFMPVMANLMVGNSWTLSKYAGLDGRLANRAPVMADPHVLASCLDWYENYPNFRATFNKRASISEFIQAGETIRNRMNAYYNVLGSEQVQLPKKTAESNIRSLSVRIYTERMLSPYEDEPDEVIDVFNDSEKEKLKSDGFIVRDNRSHDQKSVAYDIRLEQHYANPTESGFFDIMFKPFDARPCYVSTTVYGSDGTMPGKCLVYDLGSKQAILINNCDVLIWQSSDRLLSKSETRDKLNDLSGGSLREGKTYAILTASGDAVARFTVSQKIDEDQWEVHFSDYIHQPEKDLIGSIQPYDYHTHEPYILQFNVGNSVIVRLRDKLCIPDGAKIVETSETYDYPCCDSSSSSEAKKENKFHARFATMNDLKAYMQTKMAMLKLVNLEDEISVNDVVMPKRAALFALIKDFGLTEKQARELVQTVAVKQASRYYVKKAAPEMERSYAGQGPGGGVEFADGLQNLSVDQYLDYPEQTPNELATVIDQLQASNTNPDIYNPMMNITPETELNWPKNEENVPQEDVFDTMFMSNMLQASRKDNLVKQYLPDLIKAEDRLGRLLINMWWHSDEFEKWYGKSEITDMEDSILNVFESLGDLNLSLQQKEVNPMGEVADVSAPDTEVSASN